MIDLKIDLKFGIGEDNLEFSEEMKKLIIDSCDILIEVIKSKEFGSEVLNYKWKHWRRGWIKGYNHTQKSPEEVLEMVLSGNDLFSNEYENDQNELNDKDIDVWVFPYYAGDDIVGMTKPNTYKTCMNLNFWNNQIQRNSSNLIKVKVKLASNIMHEYCHNLGFKHKGNKPNRNYNRHSVPYALGKMISNIYKNGFSKTYLFKDDDEYIYEDCSFTGNFKG